MRRPLARWRCLAVSPRPGEHRLLRMLPFGSPEAVRIVAGSSAPPSAWRTDGGAWGSPSLRRWRPPRRPQRDARGRLRLPRIPWDRPRGHRLVDALIGERAHAPGPYAAARRSTPMVPRAASVPCSFRGSCSPPAAPPWSDARRARPGSSARGLRLSLSAPRLINAEKTITDGLPLTGSPSSARICPFADYVPLAQVLADRPGEPLAHSSVRRAAVRVAITLVSLPLGPGGGPVACSSPPPLSTSFALESRSRRSRHPPPGPHGARRGIRRGRRRRTNLARHRVGDAASSRRSVTPWRPAPT